MTITEQATGPVSLAAQALYLAPPVADAPGAPGRHVPGFTGQGWSTHETMLVVRWLFAHPDVWGLAMAAARAEPDNPHTVADTLHEKLVPRSELDQIAAQGFDPAKVNWLEIAHELIERRHDPRPAQEHAGTPGRALDLAPDAGAVPDPAGAPVPDDPTAIAMFTAHRLDDTLHSLAHATERMTAARAAATGDLRAYHSARVAFHLQQALDNGHRLVAVIREHYPAEASELEQVKQAVGLAKSLTPEVKAATTAHLLETTLHEETHGVRHAQAMLKTDPDDVWEFNADHCSKHLGGAVEHASKLAQHFRDNYPDVARWLDGLDEITAPAEEGGDGKPQHARYAKSAGTVSAQMANPETISGQAGVAGPPKSASISGQLAGSTISGQLDLSAASRAKAHATASATARAHWRRDELRDRRGQWTRTAGGPADVTGMFDEGQRGGRKPVTVKEILAEWHKSKNELASPHLNKAAAALDAGDRDTAIDELRQASSYFGIRGDEETGDRVHQMAASLSDESRANAAVADFATKGAKAVTGLLGAGHNGWNGKVDLFNAEDKPAIAAALNWDGTMAFQRELAQKMRDGKSGRIDDPQPYVTALHELIHGALPGGQEPAEWKALAPEDKAVLSAFDDMDKANPSGGAYPTLHSLADVRKRSPQVTQDTIDSLADRGLLEKSDSTSSYTDPETGEQVGPYHSWKMTGKARDMIPAPAQTHAMHSKAYQDPTVASVEEGFTELGTAHHAPEFFAKMGIGDRPTNVLASEGGRFVENPDYTAQITTLVQQLRDAQDKLRADGRPPQRQAAEHMESAISDAQNGLPDDVAGVITEMTHLGDPGAQAMAERLAATLDKVTSTPESKHATMTEYAKRLRDPERIAKGEAWQHYGWQTAAAQSWVQDAAKAEGKGAKSPRVRELADEINREGVGGKVPAMARQVIRAAGGNPDDFAGQPFLALEARIREQWPQGPAEAQASPWVPALAAAQDYMRSHP